MSAIMPQPHGMGGSGFPTNAEYAMMDGPCLDPRQMGSARPAIVPSAIWRKNFAKCLRSIQGAGYIAAFHHYSRFTNPGLTLNVPGDGTVSLPLSERDAEAVIKEACRLHSCLPSAATPNVWELHYPQFQLTNPAWPPFLDELARDVATRLNLQGAAAEPDRLILCEPGASPCLPTFYRGHGIVGTLAVCLPSQHHGGDVLVSFEQRTATLSTAPMSRFDLTTMAWFSDTSHEIKELISGHRLVLIYRLYSPVPRSAAKALGDSHCLRKYLFEWLISYTQLQKLVIGPLQPIYIETAPSLDNMTSRDKSVCLALHNICSNNGFYFLFSQTIRTDPPFAGSSCAYGGVSSTVMLATIYSHMGEPIATDVRLEAGEILVENFWGHGGYEGGEFHCGIVALIMPKNRISSLVSNYSIESSEVEIHATCLIRMISQDLEQSLYDENTKHAALETMGCVIESNARIPIETVRLITMWALSLGGTDLWTRCITASVQKDSYRLGIFQALETFLTDREDEFDWNERLGAFVQNAHPRDIDQLIQGVRKVLTSSTHINSLNAWFQFAMDQKIQSQDEWQIQDLAFITDNIWSRYEDSPWILDTLLPLIASRGSSDLLFELLHLMSEKRMNGDDLYNETMYKLVIQHADTKLDLHLDDLPDAASTRQNLSRARKFVRFIAESTDNEASIPANEVLERSLRHICEAPNWPQINNPELFSEEFLFPLVKAMWYYRRATDATRTFLKLALRKVIHAPIAPELRPSRRYGWTHRPRGCYRIDCYDCRELDNFLVSQNRIWDFTAGERRRAHIEERLPTHIFACFTIREGSPHTLEVTKLESGRENEYIDDLARFRKSVHGVEYTLLKFKLEYFQDILGADSYRELILLKDLNGRDIWGPIPGIQRMVQDNGTTWPQRPPNLPTNFREPSVVE